MLGVCATVVKLRRNGHFGRSTASSGTLPWSPLLRRQGGIEPFTREWCTGLPRLMIVVKTLTAVEHVVGGHRQLPTAQKGQSRGILDAFCSCPMVRSIHEMLSAMNTHQLKITLMGLCPLSASARARMRNAQKRKIF